MRRLQGREYHTVKESLVPFAYKLTSRGNICVYFERGYKHYLSDEEKGMFNPTGLRKIDSEAELNYEPLIGRVLKAWEIMTKDSDKGYGQVVFAVTPSEAIKASQAYALDCNMKNKRVKRLKFLDGKQGISPRELKIELIRNGWEFYIIDTLVTKDNVDEAIKRNYI